VVPFYLAANVELAEELADGDGIFAYKNYQFGYILRG
jgi:hypothetical protein